MSILRFSCLALLAASAIQAQSPSSTWWRLVGAQTGEYGAVVDSAVAHSGQRSGRIDGFAAAPFGPMSLSLAISPDRYRGKRVKLSAYVKLRDVTGTGAYVLFSTATAQSVLTSATSSGTPLRGTSDWQLVTATGDVPENAIGLYANAGLNGHGTMWVDDVSLEVVGDAKPSQSPSQPASNANASAQMASMTSFFASLPAEPNNLGFENGSILTFAKRSPLEPPRAVTSRGLENLVAFARVAGVVRHFHPTEAVRTTNWDDFFIRGVRAVESAPNADSLARTMTALFANVAPQVRIVAGAPPRMPAQRPDLGARLAVAYWSNTGLMLGAPNPAMPNIYSSVLVVSPAPDGHPATGVPNPDSMWTASLAGGVSAVVPTALWTTLPDDEAARRKPVAPPVPGQEGSSPSDRAVRIAGVITTWNVFQHSYPYFDIVGVDWNAELPRALKTAATDPTPNDYLGTLRRLVAAARDGHGNVYPLGGMTRRGFLSVALDWVENQLVVTRVGEGAPSEIKRGDVIESIDGIKSLDVLKKREEQISGATAQWIRYRAVNDVTVGDSGAVINLRLATGRNVKLSFSSLSGVTDQLPEKITELRPGIYYVDIGRITNEDFTAALPKLVQAHGVVFDMRGYPRQVSTPIILARLSSDTIRSAHFEAPTFPYPDRRAVQYNRDGGWVLPPLQPRIPGKIAFLTGGGAISYAESTMGIVEQFKLGEIVGGTSAGTNGNVNPFTVMGVYSIAYTGMRVRKLDNTPHHGVGIKPTIPAPRTIRGVAAGRDEALDRAVIAVGGAPIVP